MCQSGDARSLFVAARGRLPTLLPQPKPGINGAYAQGAGNPLREKDGQAEQREGHRHIIHPLLDSSAPNGRTIQLPR